MSKYCSYCGDEIEDAEDMYEIMDRNGLIARLCRFCWVIEKPFLPGDDLVSTGHKSEAST